MERKQKNQKLRQGCCYCNCSCLESKEISPRSSKEVIRVRRDTSSPQESDRYHQEYEQYCPCQASYCPHNIIRAEYDLQTARKKATLQQDRINSKTHPRKQSSSKRMIESCVRNSQQTSQCNWTTENPESNTESRHDCPYCASLTRRASSSSRFNSPPIQSVEDYFIQKPNKLRLTSSSSISKSGGLNPVVVRLRNGQELRESVRAQIEVQNAIDEFQSVLELKRKMLKKSSPCERAVIKCRDCEREKMKVVDERQSEEESKKSPTKPEKQRSRSLSPDTIPNVDMHISADEMVQGKVFNPIIRSFQEMYLKTKTEEIAIMESLIRMPALISKIYRQAALARK
ncbi:uncharacterized protein LOC108097902 [Drosophila ficusphila]|uniref:uncharacterized protein LOC108097902 n=1 Tax=Drosophila ficusphila TaxID=30025 RepID=UPI0007E6EC16|nr:uncharacterized protein LOC108097902 [Drosophila ficusphila]